jgi:Mn-dependent DtxR family transcriptional regulator
MGKCLSPSQDALLLIFARDGWRSRSELAQEMGISKSGVHHLVDKLRRKGMLTEECHARLTPVGRERANELAGVADRINEAIAQIDRGKA